MPTENTLPEISLRDLMSQHSAGTRTMEPIAPHAFDSEGNPVRSVDSGFGSALGASLALGPLYNKEAGPIRYLLNSGAEWLASRDVTDIHIPIQTEPNGYIMTPEGSMEPSGQSFWKGLHPTYRGLLEKAGATEDDYLSLTYDEAVDRYQFQVTEMNLLQTINEYSQGEFKLGLFGAQLGATLVTDPTAWAIAIISGGSGLLSKVPQTGGLAARAGSTLGKITRFSEVFQNPMARGIILHGSNFSLGAADSMARQWAKNETLQKYYQTEPEAIHWDEVGLTGLASFALGAGIQAAFAGTGRLTNAALEAISPVQSSTPGSMAALRGILLREAKSEHFPDLDTIELGDAAFALAKAHYGEYWAHELKNAMAGGRYPNKEAMENLVTRLLNKPSDDEFLGELVGEFTVIKTDLEVKLEDISRLQHALRDTPTGRKRSRLQFAEKSLQAEVEEARASITKALDDITRDPKNWDPRVVRVMDQINDDLSTRPQLNTGRLSPDGQAAVVETLLKGDLTHNQQVHLGILAQIGDATAIGKFATKLSELGTGKSHVRHDELEHPILGILAQALDPFSMTISSIDPKAKGLPPSFQAQQLRVRRKTETMVLRPWRTVRGKNISRAEERAITKEAMRVAGGVIGSTDHRAQALASGLREFFDYMGQKGVKNGTLASYLDNYLPIYLNPKMIHRVGGPSGVGDRLFEWFLTRYLDEDVIHNNTWQSLIHNQFVNEGLEVPLYKKYEGLPITKKSQLDEDDLKLYLDALQKRGTEEGEFGGQLFTESRQAIRRRLGEDFREVYATKGGDIDPAPRLHPDERYARKIEQEFWLQDEFLDNGLVIHEPSALMAHYQRRGGYKIYEQDSLNALMGRQDISWSGVSTFLDRYAQKNPEVRDTVEWLKTRRDMLRGVTHYNRNDELLKAVEPVFQLADATIHAGTGMTGLQVETSLMFMSDILGLEVNKLGSFFMKRLKGMSRSEMEAYGRTSSDIRRQTRYIVDQVDDLDADVGYTFSERLTNAFTKPFRNFKDSEKFPSGNPSKNKALQFVTASTESASEVAHLLGMEEPITNFTRHYSYHSSFFNMKKNHKRLIALDELLKKNPLSDDPATAAKEFKGLARKAGFKDYTEAQQYTQAFGDRWDKNIEALRILKDEGFDGWHEVHNYQQRALTEQDSLRAAQIDELTDSLIDFADVQSRFDVPEATVSDLNTDQGVFGRAFMKYTTFSRAFASKKLNRLLESPMTRGVPYLMMNTILEINLMNTRAILYGGMSAESLEEKWNENPKKMMALALARVPWVGPWTDMTMGIIQNMTSDDAYNTFGGSMMGRMVDDLVDVSRKGVQSIYDDSVEWENRDQKALNRYLPLWNLPVVRFIERALNSFEDNE